MSNKRGGKIDFTKRGYERGRSELVDQDVKDDTLSELRSVLKDVDMPTCDMPVNGNPCILASGHNGKHIPPFLPVRMPKPYTSHCVEPELPKLSVK